MNNCVEVNGSQHLLKCEDKEISRRAKTLQAPVKFNMN